jgi:DNA-binding MarR family transcriptional regulator
MKRVRQRRGLVVLVVLLLGLSLVAPAAAGPHDDGTTSGDSFDEPLDDSDDSTDDSSTDDSDSSDTDSTSDFDSDSDSGLSSSSDDDSTDSDSDSGLSSSSDDGSSDSDSDELTSGDETSSELPMGLSESLPSMVTDGTSDATAGSVSDAELVDVDTTTTDGTASYQVELVELDDTGDSLLQLTTTTTTTEVVSTVGTFGDSIAMTNERLTVGTGGGTSATTDVARVDATDSDPAPPIDGGMASIGTRDSRATGGGAATERSAISFPVSGDDLPGGPAGAGAIVGLAGAAAAIAARQSGALSGMTGSLGTTARTAAASVPWSSHLDRLVRMLAPFRYSRYDDSDPLEHEARDAMFEVVEGSPGTYLSEIADRAELPLSTARHHIRVLEREDLITGAKVRGKRRFYPAHTDGVELAAAMNDESTAAVIDALARLGAASVSDLADELGKDPSTVTHHVQRLEEDEVVVRERDGRAVMNKLTAAARTMLEPEESPAEGPTAGEAMASD